eukprot:scaffold3667_cov110-Isochrysis_galbana.AAC.7
MLRTTVASGRARCSGLVSAVGVRAGVPCCACVTGAGHVGGRVTVRPRATAPKKLCLELLYAMRFGVPWQGRQGTARSASHSWGAASAALILDAHIELLPPFPQSRRHPSFSCQFLPSLLPVSMTPVAALGVAVRAHPQAAIVLCSAGRRRS